MLISRPTTRSRQQWWWEAGGCGRWSPSRSCSASSRSRAPPPASSRSTPGRSRSSHRTRTCQSSCHPTASRVKADEQSRGQSDGRQAGRPGLSCSTTDTLLLRTYAHVCLP
jgi:hypothetical protein